MEPGEFIAYISRTAPPVVGDNIRGRVGDALVPKRSVNVSTEGWSNTVCSESSGDVNYFVDVFFEKAWICLPRILGVRAEAGDVFGITHFRSA